MLVIIDADPIVYRSGFAGEQYEYHLIVESPEGDVQELIFRRTDEKTANKKMREWIAAHEDWSILDTEKVTVPEPVENVLYTVRRTIMATQHAVAEKFGIDIFDIKTRLLLSGPGNFRDRIATVLPYKGNRDDATKPHWYQQIRNYLTEHWDAEVIEGREADDECAIAQYAHDGPSIICTIDKDLDMVPGHHYDYVRKTFYEVGEDEGHLLFYKQVLSGDSTDNIPGCYKIGAVKSDRIIDAVFLEHGLDHGKIWNTILDTYQNSLEQYGEACPYYVLAEREGTAAVAIEMARLVKMQEFEGQLWCPPGIPDMLLEDMDDE